MKILAKFCENEQIWTFPYVYYKKRETCQQHVKRKDYFLLKIYVFPKVVANICVRQEQIRKAA